MQTHKKEIIDSISCPFPLSVKDIDWSLVKSIISIDDKMFSVVVKMEDDSCLIVEIPSILYGSIYKSGELNVIEEDLGFDELY